jgi:hypothetical protein
VPEPSHVTEARLPRHTALFAGLFGLAMIALLATQVVLISDQDRTVKRQLAKQVELTRPSVPVLRDARPLVAALSRSDPEATARRTRALIAELLPLARGLRAENAPQALAESATLAQRLLAAGAPQAIAETATLTRRLLETGAVERGARAAEQAARAAARIDEVIALQREAVTLQRRSLAINRRSLAIQDRTQAILLESLGIQRQTLTHAESIDRKTGGPAPAPLP